VASGSLSCISSFQIHFPPFVVLEGPRAAVAAVALAKAVLRNTKIGGRHQFSNFKIARGELGDLSSLGLRGIMKKFFWTVLLVLCAGEHPDNALLAQKCPDSFNALVPKGAKLITCLGSSILYHLTVEFPKDDPSLPSSGFTLKIQKMSGIDSATLKGMLTEYIQNAEIESTEVPDSVQATQIAPPVARQIPGGKAWYLKTTTQYRGRLAPNEPRPVPRVSYICKYVVLHGDMFLFLDAMAQDPETADGWVDNIKSKLK
jgi:hypothetical protein